MEYQYQRHHRIIQFRFRANHRRSFLHGTLGVRYENRRTGRRRAHHTENRHRAIRCNRRILLRQSRELHPIHSTERTGDRHRIRVGRNHGAAIMAVGHRHDPQHLRHCRHHLWSRARVLRVPRLRCGRHHFRRNRQSEEECSAGYRRGHGTDHRALHPRCHCHHRHGLLQRPRQAERPVARHGIRNGRR